VSISSISGFGCEPNFYDDEKNDGADGFKRFSKIAASVLASGWGYHASE